MNVSAGIVANIAETSCHLLALRTVAVSARLRLPGRNRDMKLSVRNSRCGLLALSALSVTALSTFVGPVSAQTIPQDVIDKIKDEGLNRSQVMQTLSYLSDVIGPRLTGSPSLKTANEWTKEKLTSWGLQNAHLEAWGPFGRGWSLEHFSAQVVAPQPFPLIAYPRAWSPGLRGQVTGEVVYINATDAAGLEQYKGKLKGTIVLISAPRELKLLTDAQAKRYTDDELAELAKPPEAGAGRRPGGARAGGRPGFGAAMQFTGQKQRFVEDEGCAAEIFEATGDDGTIYVQSASVAPPVAPPPADPAATPPAAGAAPAAAPPRRLQPWDKDAGKMVPQIAVSAEQYNRLVRMIGFGVKPKITLDLAVKYYDQDPMAYNTVAEIPGTDKKDELVMLGGHMDSWHSGTGATDNGAGVAVCMEAVRILQALKLQPRRTVRIALWSGEEEGLFGSHAYVGEHFGSYPPRTPGSAAQPRDPNAPPPVLTKKAEYDKLSAYFNLDNGAGKIRGVYLQGNEAVRSIFQEWLAPFKDLGATTLTIRNTGSTDHVSFDGIGLPGFQFIQDGLEYGSRTHHSNQDVFDRVPADDMKQAAVIMAAFVYGAAMRDDKLPHKPAAN